MTYAPDDPEYLAKCRAVEALYHENLLLMTAYAAFINCVEQDVVGGSTEIPPKHDRESAHPTFDLNGQRSQPESRGAIGVNFTIFEHDEPEGVMKRLYTQSDQRIRELIQAYGEAKIVACVPKAMEQVQQCLTRPLRVNELVGLAGIADMLTFAHVLYKGAAAPAAKAG